VQGQIVVVVVVEVVVVVVVVVVVTVVVVVAAVVVVAVIIQHLRPSFLLLPPLPPPQLLVEKDHSLVNVGDISGRTPTHLAAMAGQVYVVELMLQQKGCSAYTKDKHGNTAFHLAAR